MFISGKKKTSPQAVLLKSNVWKCALFLFDNRTNFRSTSTDVYYGLLDSVIGFFFLSFFWFLLLSNISSREIQSRYLWIGAFISNLPKTWNNQNVTLTAFGILKFRSNKYCGKEKAEVTWLNIDSMLEISINTTIKWNQFLSCFYPRWNL